jgi:hypothetical protein
MGMRGTLSGPCPAGSAPTRKNEGHVFRHVQSQHVRQVQSQHVRHIQDIHPIYVWVRTWTVLVRLDWLPHEKMRGMFLGMFSHNMFDKFSHNTFGKHNIFINNKCMGADRVGPTVRVTITSKPKRRTNEILGRIKQDFYPKSRTRKIVEKRAQKYDTFCLQKFFQRCKKGDAPVNLYVLTSLTC